MKKTFTHNGHLIEMEAVFLQAENTIVITGRVPSKAIDIKYIIKNSTDIKENALDIERKIKDWVSLSPASPSVQLRSIGYKD